MNEAKGKLLTDIDMMGQWGKAGYGGGEWDKLKAHLPICRNACPGVIYEQPAVCCAALRRCVLRFMEAS